ncbi:MAG: bifunctional diaminohydroxyphosphoribosylaminopyrimidine deaminase/5-amino-6-(5-phosphoribosylamino)uracil reductase RibD [Spirochaetales bacterium]|nr:bifunctional diaminohydroxyphosphoribosylaminopyrimidine deaminase/5-amino-6-(5-phosphoribosylamino)uracil reductase RibD [Spirochaetales bacterium]
MTSQELFHEAWRLAREVPSSTLPNPPVGAVLVKEGRILASGAHRGPGQPHAEIVALEEARRRGVDVRGAVLYCTLEPCCHTSPGKRTPPCVPRLIDEGIKEVWIGCADPNPEVAGQGAAQLSQAGVDVHWAPDQSLFQDLIREFRVGIVEHRSWVTLKWAQTLDGYAAAPDGSSQWITGLEARTEAHRLRARCQAVLVGAGTLRRDNPSLTVRHVEGQQPARVIWAGQQPLPETAQVFTDEWRDRTWILAQAGTVAWDQATRLTPGRRLAAATPAEVVRVLYEAGLGSVLVEGGPQILTAFYSQGVWDSLAVFQAPKLLGAGQKALFGTATSMADARELRVRQFSRLGFDLLWELERQGEGNDVHGTD